jgi:ElaB/YqjD/DUF883 family membrane-anchored ribosome-binding protein
MEFSMNDQIKGQITPGQSLSAGGTSPPTDNASHEEESLKVTAADIKQKVSDNIHAASDFAQQEVATVTDKAKEAADEQKNFLADKVIGVAQAMEKVAKELEQGDNPEIGRMTRSLGSTMQKFSDDIQDRSLGEIAGMAEDFGRKQPLAFLGIAAVAGLAASRFLTASAPPAGTSGKPETSLLNASDPRPIGMALTAPIVSPAAEGRSNG